MNIIRLLLPLMLASPLAAQASLDWRLEQLPNGNVQFRVVGLTGSGTCISRSGVGSVSSEYQVRITTAVSTTRIRIRPRDPLPPPMVLGPRAAFGLARIWVSLGWCSTPSQIIQSATYREVYVAAGDYDTSLPDIEMSVSAAGQIGLFGNVMALSGFTTGPRAADLRLAAGPNWGSGLLAVGAAPTSIRVPQFYFLIDPTILFFVPVALDGAGNLTLPVTIPPGAAAWVQGLFLDPRPSPQQVVVSNSLFLR